MKSGREYAFTRFQDQKASDKRRQCISPYSIWAYVKEAMYRKTTGQARDRILVIELQSMRSTIVVVNNTVILGLSPAFYCISLRWGMVGVYIIELQLARRSSTSRLPRKLRGYQTKGETIDSYLNQIGEIQYPSFSFRTTEWKIVKFLGPFW